MERKRGTFIGKGPIALLLAFVMLLSFCTGCRVSPEPSPEPDDTETSMLEWKDVQTGPVIDTLNVVLVIDTSSSTFQADSNRNWIEAPCMFLDTLYASAGRNDEERLPGSKRINVNVILYNDVVVSYSEQLMNLGSKYTVDSLKGFIRHSYPTEGGDSALADALDTAVRVLSARTPDNELSERSVIMLCTDGYEGYSFNDSEPIRSAPANSTYYEAPSLPYFGDDNQAMLETALKRARERQYETLVLMYNSDGTDKGWDQFKRIANYTQRNLMAELMPILHSHMEVFNNLPFNDIVWPEDYEILKPPFLNDPMFGGGIFLETGDDNQVMDSFSPSPEVNYLTAKSSADYMMYYVTLAANMLSGSSAYEGIPVVDVINGSEHNRYDIEIQNSGISALMLFSISSNGISGLALKGPDPDHPGELKDYTEVLRKSGQDGWGTINDSSVRIRPVWYASGDIVTVVTVTIANPTPGTWSAYFQGKDGINSSLHTYVKLVNGAKANISFCQGNDAPNGKHPLTGGDFAVQFHDSSGRPFSEDFYDNLKIQCVATRIPPWIPISGEEDYRYLMRHYSDWLKGVLDNFREPEEWLTQMSGGKIEFTPYPYSDSQEDENSSGTPALVAHFDAPLPGLYYVVLNMTAGEGKNLIDYSVSFWVKFEPKTDRQVVIRRVGLDAHLLPPYLPDAWSKTSNTSVAEKLDLSIKENSLKISPPYLATAEFDTANPQSIVIHAHQKGTGVLSFDVTSKYGDRWTLKYDVIIER